MKCPECRGRRYVERYGWQNNGHGCQEYVYKGCGPCPACDSTGSVPDPDRVMDEFVAWLESA
jgi:hypothetical protein